MASWTLYSNFISMWNPTRNTGEILKLKCTRDTPGFHIKQKLSIILRDHKMHLTHLHLQHWTQISHKMSEAFFGMGRSWHIIVLACGPKCIISIQRCREKGRERECWRMGTSQYLLSQKISLESQQPSTHNWFLKTFKISESQFIDSCTPPVGQGRIAAPTRFLGLQKLPTRPQITVPAGPRTWRPVTPVTWLVWPGGPVRAAPWFRWRGRSVVCGEVAWRDLCATRLATWLVGIHVDCQLSYPARHVVSTSSSIC